MNLRPQAPESLGRRFARARGWLIPAALLVLTPKCVLCVLGYAGLGAALGLGGPEICGAGGDTTGHQAMWLAAAGAALGLVAFRFLGRNHRDGPKFGDTGETQIAQIDTEEADTIKLLVG